MKIELDLPDSAYNICVHYEYKGKFGETIYAAKAIVPEIADILKKMKEGKDG